MFAQIRLRLLTTVNVCEDVYSSSVVRPNQLVLQLTNARSILPKIPEIRPELTSGRRPDVIAETESWLKESVPDGVVSLPGFDVHRRNRLGRR